MPGAANNKGSSIAWPIKKGVLSRNNGELVEKTVELANVLKRENASPADVTRTFGQWKIEEAL